MGTLDKKTVDPDGGGSEDAAAARHEQDDPCRCKETAQMTPRQLLGRMLSDLAFWKKTGPDK